MVVLKSIIEEEDVEKLLKDAVNANDLVQITDSLSRVNEMGMQRFPQLNDFILRAQALCVQLRLDAVRNELQTAVEQRDIEALCAAVTHAKNEDISDAECADARTLIEAIENLVSEKDKRAGAVQSLLNTGASQAQNYQEDYATIMPLLRKILNEDEYAKL